MGRSQAALDEVRTATAGLQQAWRGAAEAWKDSQRQKFDTECIGPLGRDVDVFRRELERLDEVLTKATQRMRSLP